MQKNRVITALLFLLLIIIIASSIVRLNGLAQQTPDNGARDRKDQSLRKRLSAVKTNQEWDALLNNLPTADYDAPEPDDPVERNKRKVKGSHYDKQRMVVKNPDLSVTLTEVTYEGKEAWPLPTDESDLIVVGEVHDRQSYLSNDKSGVYTEFSISISEVLKGDSALISQGHTITASRAGGVVQYRGGHKRLYLVSGEGLPLDGGQYVLFLKRDGEDKNYLILTLYQLGTDGVTPIDEGSQFEIYRGLKKPDFLNTIQDKISKAPNSHL